MILDLKLLNKLKHNFGNWISHDALRNPHPAAAWCMLCKHKAAHFSTCKPAKALASGLAVQRAERKRRSSSKGRKFDFDSSKKASYLQAYLQVHQTMSVTSPGVLLNCQASKQTNSKSITSEEWICGWLISNWATVGINHHPCMDMSQVQCLWALHAVLSSHLLLIRPWQCCIPLSSWPVTRCC